MEPKTPPTGTPAVPPPRALPTMATVQTTVEVLVGQVKGMRSQLEALERVVRDSNVQRISIPPASVPTPIPRPSMAAKAAKDAGNLGKVVMIATGVVTVAGQLVALWKPEYTGPFIQALKLLASLGGAEP